MSRFHHNLAARERDISSALFVIGAGAVTLLAAWMRLHGVDPDGNVVGLGYFGLWYDEAFSALIALKPWPDLFWIARQDVHPPLFYILLKIWFSLAPDATINVGYARLLPALLGVACVPALGALGAIVFSKRVGLLAALLLALQPYHVFYSHELRMYSLACLVITIEMIFLWRVARRPNGIDGVFFCLFAALALFTQYYAVMVLIGHFAFFAMMRAHAGERFWIWARHGALLALGVVLFYLPWFYTFLAHALNNTGEGVHAFSAGADAGMFVQYALEWTLGSHPWFPFESHENPLPGFRKGLAAGALLYGLLAAGCVLLFRRREQRPHALFVTGALLIPVFLTGLYIVGPGRFYSRVLLFLFPAIFLLMAWAILALPRRHWHVFATLLVVAPFWSSTNYYLQNGLYRDTHHLAHRMIAIWPKAPILCSRPFDFLPTTFYDYPRERTWLLNSNRVSYIQKVLMGNERMVYRRERVEKIVSDSPADPYVILVVSDWDFGSTREQRIEAQRKRVESFERLWLPDFRAVDQRMFFPGLRKWVYCGLYRRMD